MIQKTKLTKTRAKHYQLVWMKYYQKSSVKVSLSIVLSVLIMAFFITTALKPTIITIIKLKKELQESKKTLEQLQSKTQALNQASKAWNELEDLIPYTIQSIPLMGIEYANLSKSIELIALETNVNLTSLNFDETVLQSQIYNIFDSENQEIIKSPISLRVTSEFPKTIRFLEHILNVDRLIDIQTITFNKEVNKDKSVVGLTISGNIYYLANKKLLDKALKKDSK